MPAYQASTKGIKMQTTLNAIKKHSPCESGWKKLLASLGKTKADDAPLELTHILQSNGLDDALWCLRALPEQYHKQIRLYACDVAEHVLPIFEKLFPEDKRVRSCIEAARGFANGTVSEEQLYAARAAAWDSALAAAGDSAWDAAWDSALAAAGDAAGDAAEDAAWAAAWAARAAAWDARAAAWAAAGDAEQNYQADLFIKYFGINKGDKRMAS